MNRLEDESARSLSQGTGLVGMEGSSQVCYNIEDRPDVVTVSETGIGVGESAVRGMKSPNAVVVLIPKDWVYAVCAPNIDDGGGSLSSFAASAGETEADIVVQVKEAGGCLDDIQVATVSRT